MSCCSIFEKPIYKDIKDLKQIEDFVDDGKFLSLIPAYDPSYSGIWRPVVILPNQSQVDYVDILSRANPQAVSVDPCNCVPDIDYDTPFEETVLDCEYCNQTEPVNNSVYWTLTDTKFNRSINLVSDYCNGANDVRTYPDDYLTKLPVLNNYYLSGLYDFKYLDQFPAATNQGLGFEQIVSAPINDQTFESFDTSAAKFCIDWTIKERLGEVVPDEIDTYHKSIDHHKKSYERYLLNNQTCGNFILLKSNPAALESVYPLYPLIQNTLGNIENFELNDTILPKPDYFDIPYGFENRSFYNIFASGNNKIGSYWKWNYSSGILCWYRYSDIDIEPEKDTRLKPGLDIYIPKGDVFFASNNGPEPLAQDGSEPKSCPSGLKLVSASNSINGVIPDESQFVYISCNLYEKTYNIFNKLVNLEKQILDINDENIKTPREKFEIACILATSPNYDEVTTDLLLTNTEETTFEDDPNIPEEKKIQLRQEYLRNEYLQLINFNQKMSTKSTEESLNKINIVTNKLNLIETLADKYGCYIWFAPNANNTLTINSSHDSNLYYDLNFEPVLKKSDLLKTTSAKGKTDCRDTTVSKRFAYDQSIEIASLIFNTDLSGGVYDLSCDSGVFETVKAANTASVKLNDTTLKSVVYSTGTISFNSTYLLPESYDLALKLVGETLCSQNLICNKELAIKYSGIGELLPGSITNVYQEGVFADDSVKLNRSYPATFFNPNIDLLGFHQDGGVYFDSNNFDLHNMFFLSNIDKVSGKPAISFKTKDIGIKLYALSIQKLRDKKNAGCKTFPLNKSCLCFPLNKISDYQYNCDGTTVYSNRNAITYTPNLSTDNTPDIKAYGGYLSTEFMEEFATDSPLTIPNHPNYGSTLAIVNKKIDPINPYECDKKISISLPNYSFTEWRLGLNEYNTNHSDIWATILEDVDLFRPTIVRFNPTDEEDQFVSNPNYKRYTSEVKINDTSVSHRQTRILFDSQTSIPKTFDLTITNPFLYALLSTRAEDIDKNKKLYFPFSCSLEQAYYLLAYNRDYFSNINISFQQIPRKNLLMFQMYPIRSMGRLSPTNFNPNYGLIDSSNSGPFPLYFDKDNATYDIDYEKAFFKESSTDHHSDGKTFKFEIKKPHQLIFQQIDELDSHKKIRLYLKANNFWYEYCNPHIFGFNNPYNKLLYPGAPFLFEYTRYDKPKSLTTNIDDLDEDTVITEPSTLIPMSPKINTKFNFFSNNRPIHNDENSALRDIFPNLSLSFVRNPKNPKQIIIKGLRLYFLLFEELISDHLVLNSTIEDTTIFDDIFIGTVVKDIDNNYWRYIYGPRSERSSYKYLINKNDDQPFGENLLYYFTNFSDLNNLNFHTNNIITDLMGLLTTGYTLDGDNILKNSSRKIDNFIDIYDSVNDPDLSRRILTKFNYKQIQVNIVDQYGNPIVDTDTSISKQIQYVEINTVLEADLCDECELPLRGFLQPVDLHKNFTILQNFNNLVYHEHSRLLDNRIIPYRTKWGDLLNYDFKENFNLQNSLDTESIINNHYKDCDYDNIFETCIINKLSTNRSKYIATYNRYLSENKDDPANPKITVVSDAFIEHDNYANYFIHKKYSSDTDNLYIYNFSKYENFIPIMDLSFKTTNKLLDDIKFNATYNVRTTGDIYISGVRQFVTGLLPEYIHPNSGSYGIACLNNEVLIKPVLFDRKFYYPTLRVDDIYFPMLSTEKTTNVAQIEGCVTHIIPSLDVDISNRYAPYFSPTNFNQIDDVSTRPYFLSPVFCDTDTAGDPCFNESCSYKGAGAIQLTSKYQHLAYIPKKFKDIADSVTDYAFSIDEGLYTFLHGDILEFPYIQRFEIGVKDTIFNNRDPNEYRAEFDPANYNVIGRKISPKYTYIDQSFQDGLTEYIIEDHSELVKNTDILANEFLFRSIYGSKQFINTNTIQKLDTKQSIEKLSNINLSDMIQNDIISPAKIYEQIPYDYAKVSDQSRRKISGNIVINGVPSIGKNFSININDTIIRCSVRNEDGTVYLIASSDDQETKSILGYTKIISSYNFAVELEKNGQPRFPISPPDENTTIARISTCKGGQSPKGWSLLQYFSEASYKRLDENDQEITINILEEYEKCVNDLAGNIFNPTNADGAVVGINSYGNCAGCACLGGSACHNRRVFRGVTLSDNCSTITSNSKKITWNGYGRGIYSDCPSRNGSIQLSPVFSVGDFDSFVGGTPVQNFITFGGQCFPKAENCKTYCYDLDDSDKAGQIYTPFRSYGFTTAGIPCECRPFNYGYCKVGTGGGAKSETNDSGEIISCPECGPYDNGYPIIFTYDFESSYHSFSSNGHILREKKGEPVVYGGKRIENGGCNGEQSNPPGDDKKSSATEVCSWIECTYDPPPSYGIYESKTTTPTEYEPLCPSYLATIFYDNNITTISLVGSSESLCIENKIRNDCPLIELIFPDNTFSFIDSITSECGTCDVDPNIVEMSEQTTDWDIIEETRTAILGTLAIEGDQNTDVGGAGTAVVSNEVCNPLGFPCCHDNCYTYEGGLLQCGRTAPDSWVWNHVLNCNLNGSPDPSFTPCFAVGQQSPPAMVNVGSEIGIGFATGSDNSTVKARHKDYWKQSMREAYNNTNICKMNLPDGISKNDIVEGIVPRSCSELQFTTISFPGTAFRQTLEGGTSTSFDYVVDIAYYTYKYRRPRTIDDVLLGEDLATRCVTRTHSSAGPIGNNGANIAEVFKTDKQACQTVPNCYDTIVPICNQDDYCCQQGKPNNE